MIPTEPADSFGRCGALSLAFPEVILGYVRLVDEARFVDLLEMSITQPDRIAAGRSDRVAGVAWTDLSPPAIEERCSPRRALTHRA